jgi:methionyl aminopeptidase
MITIKGPREIELMRQAGQIVAAALQEVARRVEPGVTTASLDHFAEKYLTEKGAKPAFKGYNGFPASICASVNEEVVHGIPGPRMLKEGDVIGIDLGALWKGFCADSALSVPVGEVSPEIKHLLKVAEEALFKGISEAQPGVRLGKISNAIQTHAESYGYSVVRQYVGHGIGRQMHEDPPVPNYGNPGRGPLLEAGMTLAIEPMVNAGGYQVVVRPDNWTVVTRDGKASVHFEHTIAITSKGPEILTQV